MKSAAYAIFLAQNVIFLVKKAEQGPESLRSTLRLPLAQHVPADEIDGEIHTALSQFTLPYGGMGLNGQSAVIAITVDKCEYSGPRNAVQTSRRRVYMLTIDARCTFNMHMYHTRHPFVQLAEIILPSAVGMRAVVFDHQLRQLPEYNFPMLAAVDNSSSRSCIPQP